MKPLKIRPIKPIRVRFNLDLDRDGVKDYKDCRPFNPKKQHISKTFYNPRYYLQVF